METRRYANDSAGRLSRVTDASGALRHPYQYDHQGRRQADINPLALATTDGHAVQAMRYDCCGNLLAQRGDVVRLPLGFAGGLFDADTGLTRFPWRDYDADTGRFTALDPLGAKGGDTDWYGYCVDDPVNRVDVGGQSWYGYQGGGPQAHTSRASGWHPLTLPMSPLDEPYRLM